MGIIINQGLQSVAAPIKDECLQEGCKIAKFQLNFNDANWTQSYDYSGGPPAAPTLAWINTIALNPQGNTTVRLSQIRAIIVSFLLTTADNCLLIVDTGYGAPFFLATIYGNQGNTEIVLPVLLPGDTTIKVSLVCTANIAGAGNGIFNVGLANYEIAPYSLACEASF